MSRTHRQRMKDETYLPIASAVAKASVRLCRNRSTGNGNYLLREVYEFSHAVEGVGVIAHLRPFCLQYILNNFRVPDLLVAHKFKQKLCGEISLTR